MHVDTGHNFPEVIEFRDRRVAELGERLIVASVQGSIDAGRVVEETGPRASRNRLQTTTLLDAIDEHGFDAAFGGARRDEERARAKERIFSFRDDFGPVGPPEPAPRAVEPLQRAHPPRRARARLPALELDRARRLAVHRLRAARGAAHLLRPRAARSSRATGCSTRRRPFVELLHGEEVFQTSVRYRTVGDMSCTGAVRSEASTLDAVVAEIAASADHRAGRDPRGRPRHRGRDGGSQAGGLLLMEPPCAAAWSSTRRRRRASASATSCAWPPPGSVDDGKCTLIGRLLYDAKADPRADQLERSRRHRSAATATARSTSRCSPTACAPSASRASPSTSPTATSRRRGASSSSPTRPATCSTRATWSPAPRRPTSAVILVDARHGILEQSKRHAFISSLLGSATW